MKEHSRFIDGEHDLVHRGAAAVLDRALELVEQLEQPAYPPAETGRLQAWGRRRLEALRGRLRRRPAAELVVEGTSEGPGPDQASGVAPETRRCLPAAPRRSSLAALAFGLGAGVHHLIDARRQAIRRVANQHQVQGLRWWPPTANPVWLDFVVESTPASVPAFRSALESALGCRVAVYLADQIPAEAWGRMLVDAVLV